MIPTADTRPMPMLYQAAWTCDACWAAPWGGFDAWEKNPDNAEALARSHEEAQRLGLPFDPSLVRAGCSP